MQIWCANMKEVGLGACEVMGGFNDRNFFPFHVEPSPVS